MFSPELKKGSTEMLILSLLEARARHGHEIGKLIEAASGRRLTFALPTPYATLLRLEDRGLITGRWVEKAGERHRCFYRLTAQGRRALAALTAEREAHIVATRRRSSSTSTTRRSRAARASPRPMPTRAQLHDWDRMARDGLTPIAAMPNRAPNGSPRQSSICHSRNEEFCSCSRTS